MIVDVVKEVECAGTVVPSGISGFMVEGLQDHGGHLLHGLGRGVDHGKAMIAVHRLGLAQLVGALLERVIARVWPSFVPDLTEPCRRGKHAETPVTQPAHRAWQLGGLEVFIDERVVGDEDAMLQGEVHRRWCLAAA